MFRHKQFSSEEVKLTWKNVFNSDLKEHLWGHIDVLFEFVIKSGYKFFIFNDSVYEIVDNRYQRIENCTVDDLTEW